MFDRLRRLVFGEPKDLNDPGTFHHISLVAFLAWVGLGADGLSSSSYGPEETFRMLGTHQHLAVILALAMVLTIAIIAYSYSRIIEHFPLGGGGYVVATTLLGPKAGLVSGSALLVDYILTISVSIAAASDATFSLLPLHYHWLKFPFAASAIVLLTVLNLRGVKESVEFLMPIFILFLITHALIIFGAVFMHVGQVPAVVGRIHDGFRQDVAVIGWAGIAALCLRAYSIGCGTYTGIEAVSNGLAIMREPKVETGQRTMLYMAASLAITAGGLIVAYLLLRVHPVEGRTMNAALTQAFADAVLGPGSAAGKWLLWGTLSAEAALLIVAAQAGFIDGPRVMANMALDSWLPRKLAGLSERLTIQDGVLMMSAASIATLLYAHGSTYTLVIMYSINVFITFTLSQLSMIRFWWTERGRRPRWTKEITIHIVGFAMCATILGINLFEKFFEGGWVTISLTAGLVAFCALIHHHYAKVRSNLARLDEILLAVPSEPAASPKPLDPKAPTAVLLVGGFGGLGMHSLLTIQRLFPGYFKNFIFVSVGVIDSAVFKDTGVVEETRRHTEKLLESYLDWARRFGLSADTRLSVSTDVYEEAERLCLEVARQYPRAIVFCGKLVFEKEGLFDRFLHNDTAYNLQRRLQFTGLNSMVLPVRVLTPPKRALAA
ncbi:MAG: APC family permease [Elusimicrobia bacterium]|nr:APC family permease [Elusimicrobiota bacterium]